MCAHLEISEILTMYVSVFCQKVSVKVTTDWFIKSKFFSSGEISKLKRYNL